LPACSRNVPPVRLTDVALTLVKLAQPAADIPELRELDINPLLADEKGVMALDARIAVEPVAQAVKSPNAANPRLAVRPYPKQWEQRITLADGAQLFMRPLRPEDEPGIRDLLERTSAADLRLRFFGPIKRFGHAFLARLVQLDYPRAIAFVAIDEANGEFLGVVSMHADSNYEKAEYAVLVRSDLKGRGIGWKLMEFLIRYARSEGLKRLEGQVLSANSMMLQMCRELGFLIAADPDDSTVNVVSLQLQ
jgi:acetyltransferase